MIDGYPRLTKEERRRRIAQKAEQLGIEILDVPGGYRLRSRKIDLLVADLWYVNESDLYPSD